MGPHTDRRATAADHVPSRKGGKHHTLPIGEDKALLMALITYRRLVNPLPTDWVPKSN
ncbi:MAG: hypothetical protein ACRDLL_12340 [Solirubrobacterales bacterium]